jgi:hypothetical protein
MGVTLRVQFRATKVASVAFWMLFGLCNVYIWVAEFMMHVDDVE